RAHLETELVNLRSRRPDAVDDLALDHQSGEAFAVAALAFQRFNDGGHETRRGLLEAVCSNLILKDKIITIYAKKQYRVIAEGLAKLTKPPAPFEPQNSGLTMRDFVDLSSAKQTIRGLVDDVRIEFLLSPDSSLTEEQRKELFQHIG